MKLAELSDSSFECRNVTFLGGRGQNIIRPSYIFSGVKALPTPKNLYFTFLTFSLFHFQLNSSIFFCCIPRIGAAEFWRWGAVQDNLILICRSVLSTSSFSRCGRRGRSSCTRTAKISSTRSSATGRGTSVTITRNSSSSASPMRFRRPPCGRGRQPTKWTAARLHRRRLRSWREAVARGPLGQSNNTVAGIDLECRAQCLSVDYCVQQPWRSGTGAAELGYRSLVRRVICPKC